ISKRFYSLLPASENRCWWPGESPAADLRLTSPSLGRTPTRVNAANVSVSTFRTLRVCLQRSVSRTLQQPFDSGTTARRTFVAVPIHSEVNRLGHPDRRSEIHRPYPSRRLPPPPRPSPARNATC